MLDASLALAAHHTGNGAIISPSARSIAEILLLLLLMAAGPRGRAGRQVHFGSWS
jgi:hypothetical protein